MSASSNHYLWGYDFVPESSPDSSLQVQIGKEIAAGVVNNINEMGLPAGEASPSTMMQLNDIVLKGYIISLNEGNAAERAAFGFGAGASELKVQVEGRSKQIVEEISARLRPDSGSKAGFSD